MKSISLLLSIILFIFSPSILLAKQICIAPSGCSIEIDTGFCPKCIEVEELPIIKEEKVIMEKKTSSQNPLAPFRFAPFRIAFFRFASLRSASLRFAPLRFASLRFAPSRIT